MSKLIIAVILTAFLTPALSSAETGNSVRNRIKIKKKSYISKTGGDDTENYNLEKFDLLAAKRRNLIQDIKRFIRESRAEDQKAELNLRLGGLYMEDYYGGLAKAQQVHERQMAEYEKNK